MSQYHPSPAPPQPKSKHLWNKKKQPEKDLDAFYDEMLAAGMEYDQSSIASEIIAEPVRDDDLGSIADFYDEMLAEAERIASRPTKAIYEQLKAELREEGAEHKDWKDLTQKQKEKCCTHQSGILRVGIRAGVIQWFPIYCHSCNMCIETQAKGLKEKFEKAEEKAKEACPDGQWRKVKVSDKKQGNALKKKLQRKEDSRYFQRENPDKPGEDEIYIWTEDKSYGEPADPAKSIDWAATAKHNKENKREVSYGKGCRPKAAAGKAKSGTEKILIPQLAIDQSQVQQVEKIMLANVPLKYAETHIEVQNLMIDWTVEIVKALREAGITIHAMHDQTLNLLPEDVINEWNDYINVARIRRKDY